MWRNDDPREVYVDQTQRIVVSTGPGLHLTYDARVSTGAHRLGQGYVAFPGRSRLGLGLYADDAWPEHWWWCLPPDRY